MNEGPDVLNPGAQSAARETDTSFLVRIWRRLPIVLRAVIVGCIVLTAGGILTGPLIYANLRLWPAVPWSVPLLAAYMWLFWQYLRGRWWPRSTAETRRLGLRAHRLSRRIWCWAMIMGYLTMVSSFALQWVVGRLAPLRYAVPDVLQQFPAVTLLAIVFTVSAVAGIVEEAAFRGYMQGSIERRHGPAVAILVVSLVFGLGHLTDWQPSMTVARMFFIVAASVVYGILAHLVDSILPGLVLHATGDAIGISWIWWLSAHRGSGSSERGFATALTDPSFMMAGVVSIVFGIAAVWAFRRLASVVRSEREAMP
jgi:membrane protease YdiL (CAAX protease family)